MAPQSTYVLHYDIYSICSSMVRLTFELRGVPRSQDDEMILEERWVDITVGKQLEEDFLVNVNPKGQVPALTSPDLPSPLTDSVDITHFMCEHYPSLAPKEHASTIYSLLEKLHEIKFLSVSFKPHQNRAEGITKRINEKLAQPDITDAYRKALHFKMQYHEKTLVHALEPDAIQLAEQQTRQFFSKVENERQLYAKEGSLWTYGGNPTALDAHMAVFIARLMDVKRLDLVPPHMAKLVKDFRSTTEWHNVMQGRPTLYDSSVVYAK